VRDIYFTDEELVAYLDGEEDFAPMDEIALALKTDISLAKRLEALRIDRKLVSIAFDGLADKNISRPSLPVSQAPKSSVQQLAMAASIALAIGLGGGYYLEQSRETGWMDYVAAYQALYINSTLNHVNISDASKQIELDRVAAAIGKNISVTDLQGSVEVEYKRAQILGFEGKALIQLAFLASTGEPMALCILRTDKSSSEDIESSELEGMRAASWVKDGYEYLLIGGKDSSLISRMAADLSKKEI